MTVGLVVVSHSRALARAAVALAQEMLHGKQIRIAIAAGLDDTTFGTDAAQIVDAIATADQGAGGVVLMDLGSAVLRPGEEYAAVTELRFGTGAPPAPDAI